MFIYLLSLSALLVAGSAAYFSVLGIASLFVGSYYQVMVMAASLELGKLVATSYLYRYWLKTTWWLKTYLIIAVLTLMGITSLGIFGYLSAAYQVNSSKINQIEQNTSLIENQKNTYDIEIQQNIKRIETLNELRVVQEQRVQDAGNYKVPREQAYAAIENANREIQTLTNRNQNLQQQKANKDIEIMELTNQVIEVKDIGTFKFIANTINIPLDKVVILFICVLICVFDPLAVCLILAFNVAVSGSVLRKTEANLQVTLDAFEPNIVSEDLPSTQPKTFHGKVKTK